jgi:hypothetical protein
MRSKQKHKMDHGFKKGHAPRAQEGHSSTGISRLRTEVLRTKNTHLLLRSKQIAPKPCIARAPKLPISESNTRLSS